MNFHAFDETGRGDSLKNFRVHRLRLINLLVDYTFFQKTNAVPYLLSAKESQWGTSVQNLRSHLYSDNGDIKLHRESSLPVEPKIQTLAYYVDECKQDEEACQKMMEARDCRYTLRDVFEHVLGAFTSTFSESQKTSAHNMICFTGDRNWAALLITAKNIDANIKSYASQSNDELMKAAETALAGQIAVLFNSKDPAMRECALSLGDENVKNTILGNVLIKKPQSINDVTDIVTKEVLERYRSCARQNGAMTQTAATDDTNSTFVALEMALLIGVSVIAVASTFMTLDPAVVVEMYAHAQEGWNVLLRFVGLILHGIWDWQAIKNTCLPHLKAASRLFPTSVPECGEYKYGVPLTAIGYIASFVGGAGTRNWNEIAELERVTKMQVDYQEYMNYTTKAAFTFVFGSAQALAAAAALSPWLAGFAGLGICLSPFLSKKVRKLLQLVRSACVPIVAVALSSNCPECAHSETFAAAMVFLYGIHRSNSWAFMGKKLLNVSMWLMKRVTGAKNVIFARVYAHFRRRQTALLQQQPSSWQLAISEQSLGDEQSSSGSQLTSDKQSFDREKSRERKELSSNGQPFNGEQSSSDSQLSNSDQPPSSEQQTRARQLNSGQFINKATAPKRDLQDAFNPDPKHHKSEQ